MNTKKINKMKKLIKLSLVTCIVLSSSISFGQDKKDTSLEKSKSTLSKEVKYERYNLEENENKRNRNKETPKPINEVDYKAWDSLPVSKPRKINSK
jgi:hypothetical protein